MPRAPGHWYREPGLRSALLSPLGALYAAGTARKLANGQRWRPGIPVICVGNLTAGGTGKTPMVMALTERLSGRSAHILSRGYGGKIEGPVAVDPSVHGAEDVGDEPLLLAGFAPVWVARDRRAGAEAAMAAGAEVLILDDGFQNGALAYDLSILVADAARGFGNGCLIPAGPLREPVARGMARADLLVSIGPDAAQERFARKHGRQITVPHLTAALDPLPTGLPLAGTAVLAFAGIGDPEKFFATLRQAGAEIKRSVPLGDHQPLTPALMTRIEQEAKSMGALMVTTEKDATRLPRDFRQKVTTVPVRLTFGDPSVLDAKLSALG